MVLPLSAVYDSHPHGWANPVALRASAALPAAGAWDAAPTESFSSGAHRLTLYFTYTEGEEQGGDGAFDWQLWVSGVSVAALLPTGAEEWVVEPIYAAGAVAAGSTTQSNVQTEYQTYTTEVAGATEEFVYGPIEFHGTVERIRVRARESGNTGTPGTLQIMAVLQ